MSYLPSNDERVEAREFIDWLVHIVHTFFDEANIKVEILPVGSVIKGTFVSGEHDVDLYVLTDTPQQAIKLASQSPYFQKEGYFKRAGPLLIWAFKSEEYDVDMVFGRPGEVKTDTLKHAQFFNELSQSQKNEVVKAKAFFKSRGLYSAEVGGITGVAIEELIRQHKSFCGLCDVLEQWPWLQDLVMKERRNLLASVIQKRQRQIQAACFAYLHDPRRKLPIQYKFFTIDKFKTSYLGYTFIEFKRKKEMILDFTIVYSACDHLMREIKNFERDICRGDFDVWLDAKHICVAVSLPQELREMKETKMNVEFTQGLQAFKTAHTNWYEHAGFLWAQVPRKIVHPLKYFEEKLTKKLMEEIGYVQE